MLSIRYQDENLNETSREILPIGIIYNVETILLIAWCELRQAFRHFRVDRMIHCGATDRFFKGQGDSLRTQWKNLEE
ncbi:MAG: putative DNA-binding transcriptional regulator YafY [Gammaproteobacteria bacterium]|jgi:predicted DNA-binding transcriptional regulator YafY